MKTIFPNYDFPIKNYASSAKHKPTYGSSGVGQYRGEIASSIITPTKRSALTKPTFKINVEYLRIRLGVGAPAGRGGFIRYASIA
ncbi:MAG: hypothetical protein H7331_07200, partial [Bacteroidia bacterium]|nr:hypothetical protein [Bacteroidia bacterium]